MVTLISGTATWNFERLPYFLARGSGDCLGIDGGWGFFFLWLNQSSSWNAFLMNRKPQSSAQCLRCKFKVGWLHPALNTWAVKIGSLIYFKNEIVNNFPHASFFFNKLEVTMSLTPEMWQGKKHFIILTGSNIKQEENPYLQVGLKGEKWYIFVQPSTSDSWFTARHSQLFI